MVEKILSLSESAIHRLNGLAGFLILIDTKDIIVIYPLKAVIEMMQFLRPFLQTKLSS